MRLFAPLEREKMAQKEQERKNQEIGLREGKIDVLRSEEVSMKKRLQDFQLKEFEKFEEEQKARKQEIEQLDSQILAKKEEWRKVLEPLDKQFARYVKTERAAIESEKVKNAEWSTDLGLKAEELALKESEVSQKEAKVLIESRQTAEIKEKAVRDIEKDRLERERLKQDAVILHEKAKKEETSARNKLEEAAQVMKQAEEYKRQVEIKEKEIEDRELAVIIKELEFYSPVTKQNNGSLSNTDTKGRAP